MTRAILLTRLAVLVSCLAAISADPLVRISARGFVAGTTRKTRSGRSVWAYLGIPYAEPPVGDLRFQNPVPKKAWDGVLSAVTDGPQCPQTGWQNADSSEDCLYLNVYTPRRYKNAEQLLPVIVSIHGGGFMNGNGSSCMQGPEYFLDKDVILVSMNYRLGMLGFLTTGDTVAPGNFGLKDQAMALRWVQQHILAFGGNPKRVTITGESAGAASVNFHALSDKSKDLFQNYIIQSGSALCPWAFHEREEYSELAKTIGQYFGCPTDSSASIIECLRGVSVEEIVAIDRLSIGSPLFMLIPWGPTNEVVHEDAFLTDTPSNLLAQNKMKNGPLMTGLVRDEGVLVTVVLYANNTIFNVLRNNLETVFMPAILRLYLPKSDPIALTKEVMKFYFNGDVSGDKDVVLKQATNFVTDLFFAYPEYAMMKHLAATSKMPFYFYNFEYRGSFSLTTVGLGSNRDIGVSHADDLIYLYPVKPEAWGLPDLSMSEVDYKVVDTMVDLWTSFATNGAPSSEHIQGGKAWPIYRGSETYLRIGNNSDPATALKDSFLAERMKFWEKHAPL